MNASFQAGIKACLPTVLGYLGIGFSAGIVGRAAGLSPLEIGLMSLLIYAGAAQFIITSLLLLNSPFSAIILTTFIVNSRHLLMSMTLAPRVKSRHHLDRFGIGALLTDESFAVAMNTSLKRPLDAPFMHGLNITAYLELDCLDRPWSTRRQLVPGSGTIRTGFCFNGDVHRVIVPAV